MDWGFVLQVIEITAALITIGLVIYWVFRNRKIRHRILRLFSGLRSPSVETTRWNSRVVILSDELAHLQWKFIGKVRRGVARWERVDIESGEDNTLDEMNIRCRQVEPIGYGGRPVHVSADIDTPRYKRLKLYFNTPKAKGDEYGLVLNFDIFRSFHVESGYLVHERRATTSFHSEVVFPKNTEILRVDYECTSAEGASVADPIPSTPRLETIEYAEEERPAIVWDASNIVPNYSYVLKWQARIM